MHTFTVWGTQTCPFCHQAEGFLSALQKQRGDIQVHVRDANAEPQVFRSLAQHVGRSTVPQIFLDDKYIGGWTELANAAKSGKLDAFLEGKEWHGSTAGNRRRGLFKRRSPSE